MSKIAHLIEVLITLQYKKLTTASELAQVLKVDKKTIYRYINNLNLANVPIHTIKGRYGGFYIDETFYMKPPKLNFQELQSIIAIEQSIEDSNFPLKRDLRNAVAKIKSICLKDDKELEEKLEGSSIKLYNLGDTLRLDEKIDKINYSMERGRTLDIEYFTINKNTLYEENVDPYNLIFKDGDWYIVGYSHDEDKVKVYRLSRIRNIDITNDIYMKPKTFSLNDFLTNSWGVFNGEKQLVKVKFSKNVAELIRKVKWSSTQEIEDLDDGSMILKFYIDELGDIKTWILGFGGEAEVIEPLSLRADINEEIKKLLNIYK
ncbi:HTH domain protein [Clostridium liquoris]|jgi:predicted DNA-binding transcriptional regulator YafY|uniref:HTH domain protein n=1 Tax=Clostridium liquoris TaxID=1289519 RepID=A0A2T0B5F1_9CLOT|nr:transcriptional regulator [Clostridium liquoris]PRR79106.1 HTH domain protein [Clostridium liquoris]